jgi:hypothetical protein
MLPHTRQVFMQNVRHVFEIVIAILKFKMTVKFDSQMIPNSVLTLILQNTQGCTWDHFKAHQISFLFYPEAASFSTMLVPTYQSTRRHNPEYGNITAQCH